MRIVNLAAAQEDLGGFSEKNNAAPLCLKRKFTNLLLFA